MSWDQSKALIEAMHIRRLNQGQLSALIKKDKYFVSMWKNNHRKMTSEHINLVSAALDMKASEFVALGE